VPRQQVTYYFHELQAFGVDRLIASRCSVQIPQLFSFADSTWIKLEMKYFVHSRRCIWLIQMHPMSKSLIVFLIILDVLFMLFPVDHDIQILHEPTRAFLVDDFGLLHSRELFFKPKPLCPGNRRKYSFGSKEQYL
jgi:hypothetical protein